MKKTFSFVIAGALLLGLTACGSQTGKGGETVAPSTTAGIVESQDTIQEQTTAGESVGEQSEDSETEKSEETGAAEAGNRTLVAYFSWSGNTEKLAGMIQSETGGTLFEITPAPPYTEDYDELLEVAQAEQSNQARPELAAQVENWEDYDTVFVGYPNWWGDTPMAVRTFLESYDFTGKTIIPFCTHGSGGFGRSLSSVKESTTGANILVGFEVAGASVDGAATAVADWLTSIGISR